MLCKNNNSRNERRYANVKTYNNRGRIQHFHRDNNDLTKLILID